MHVAVAGAGGSGAAPVLPHRSVQSAQNEVTEWRAAFLALESCQLPRLQPSGQRNARKQGTKGRTEHLPPLDFADEACLRGGYEVR